MRGELKAKGERKPFRIAFDLLVQVPDLYAVEFGEVGVEDDPLPTQNEDFRINFSCGHNRCLRDILELVSDLRSQIVISSFRED